MAATKNATVDLGDGIALHVPLSIGTLQWGTTPLDHRFINAKGCISETETARIVREFRDANVTLFDTAEGYGGGTSEKRLGRITTDAYESSDLEPILMTKFLPSPWRYSHNCFERALRGSLRRMGVKCCSIYLLHSPCSLWRPLEYWVESAALCKKKGLLKAFGLSNCNAEQVRTAVMAGKKYGVPVLVNQVHYSLLDYNSPSLQEMEATCKELGVVILAYTPIGQGLLTDKINVQNFPQNRPAKMLRLGWDDLCPIRECIKKVANKHGGKTMAQVAINWCIAHGTVPLVGCRSVEQAKDSLGALGWSLDEGDVRELDGFALKKSTLESPHWRRMLFVTLAGVVMTIARVYDLLGYGMVKEAAL